MEATISSQMQGKRRNEDRSVTGGRGFRVLLAASVLGVAAITVSQKNNNGMTQLLTTSSGSTNSQTKTLSFAVGNSLRTIADNDVINSLKIDVGYPWEFIIEPHRETTFQARDNFCDDCTNEQYEWSINGDYFVGREVTFASRRVGSHEIILTVTDADGAVIQHTDSVMSKYVRREWRKLTDDDRELVFNAIHAIYTHSTSEGIAKGYGDNFLDIAHFVAKHLDGSAGLMCDAWHDGAAFYTTHAAFSLEFEMAMQAVVPQVSLPYWDFTLDAYHQAEEGTDWKSSVLFSDTWFGSVFSKHSDHAIDSGKFAFTPVKKVGYTDEVKHNPYGLLRSPWNVNKSPYVTRSAFIDGYKSFDGVLPSCQDYMECFLSDSMAVMTECLNGKTHGSVHVQIGGLWDKDISKSIIPESSGYNLLLLSKNLWRQGWVRCPQQCSAGETCECEFNDVARGDMTAYKVIVESGMIGWLPDVSHKIIATEDGNYRIDGVETEEQEHKAWEMLLKETLGKLGSVGEMFSSASPYDPTFWIIHGTIDRLVHWRRLVAHSDAVDLPFGEKWGYAHNVDAASDTNLICDWQFADVADYSTMPKCMDGACPGTYKDDITPFSSFVGDKDDVYTNEDMLKFLSPLNDELPYVYEDFEWSHCDAEGYSFGVQKDGVVLKTFTLPKKLKVVTKSMNH